MILNGKVALITGGARGIGRAIAEELLQHGAQVCLLDVLGEVLTQTETELTQKFGEGRVITVEADITSEEQFKATFEQTVAKFGKIDILVNNASIQKEGLWEKMMAINLGGTIRGTLLAMKYMNPENGGVVVNISSISGVNITHGQMPLIPVYSAVKSAVNAYTKCFALNKEVVAKKIRIVSLCPRSTESDMFRNEDSDRCWDLKNFLSADRGRIMLASEVSAIFRLLIEDDTNSGKVALIEDVNKYTFV